jgi:hypothetical protein
MKEIITVKLAPKGLGFYNTTITKSTIFEDTFAYSQEEAEELALSSFYGGGGQGALDYVDATADAVLVTDDQAEVQQMYEECWNEGPVAEPRG